MRNCHPGRRGGGLPSSFKGRPSLLSRYHREPHVANPPSAPSLDKEAHSDDEIFREIEDYEMEAEREERVQAGDLSLYVFALDVQWLERASSSGGAEPSTSGALPTGPDLRYICEDWVSDLSNKKLGFISREFRLGNSARWAA